MKTTTTTREYDEQGRLVREITVEVEHPTRPFVVDDTQWWQPPREGWWRNPVISCTVPNTGHVLVN